MAQQRAATPDTAIEAAMRAQQEAAAALATDFTGNCGAPDIHAPPCEETTASLGKFRIYIAPRFRALFTGYPRYQCEACTGCPLGPGYNNQTDFRLESPCLIDQFTKIGRSAAHTQGSTGPNSDTGGTLVGHHPGTSVSDSDFSVMPSLFQVPAISARREIHTQIIDLNLTDVATGVSVRAGSNYVPPFFRPSYGEVQSQSTGGNDLPADSFFDVFVEVDLPSAALFQGATVYNQQALLVLNDNVINLPPTVVYIHGNSSMVPVYFKSPSTLTPPVPSVPWVANDLLGYLVLAGHGVGSASCECQGQPASAPPRCFKDVYCDPTIAKEMTGLGGCCLPDGTCETLDLQGCNDAWLPLVDNGDHYAGDGNLCKCGGCCKPNVCIGPVLDTKCHAMGGHFEGNGVMTCPHNPDGSCTLGACCRPNNQCTLDTTEDECIKLGGRYLGDGSTSCAHDAAGDCIPTVSEWGLLVMAVLVLTAATVVIMRRRAMVHGGS